MHPVLPLPRFDEPVDEGVAKQIPCLLAVAKPLCRFEKVAGKSTVIFNFFLIGVAATGFRWIDLLFQPGKTAGKAGRDAR